MQTIGAFIDRALTLLHDAEPGFEATLWSKPTLLGHLNEGLCQIAAMRPDLFTGTHKIPLRPGSHQELPEGFAAIYGVDGNVQVGPDGQVTVEDDVHVSDQAMLRRFKKKPCLASDALTDCGDAGTGYRVKTFIPNPHNLREFRVEPPVPEGANVEIMATVLKTPRTYTDADLSRNIPLECPNTAALMDWVLHRAYCIESESEYIRSAKNDHLRYFYGSVNGKYFADSRMRSGYVLGQTGTGDERSGAPRELRNLGVAG